MPELMDKTGNQTDGRSHPKGMRFDQDLEPEVFRVKGLYQARLGESLSNNAWYNLVFRRGIKAILTELES